MNVTLRRFVESWSSGDGSAEDIGVMHTGVKVKDMTSKNQASDLEWLQFQLEADESGEAADPPYHFKLPSRGVAREWMAADAELPWFHHRQEGTEDVVFSHGKKLRQERALWFLGPRGSGPFFHVHPAAYNALLYGKSHTHIPHSISDILS